MISSLPIQHPAGIPCPKPLYTSSSYRLPRTCLFVKYALLKRSVFFSKKFTFPYKIFPNFPILTATGRFDGRHLSEIGDPGKEDGRFFILFPPKPQIW